MIAIGVGPTVDTEELISIASQPSDNNVFMATSLDDLTSLVEYVIYKSADKTLICFQLCIIHIYLSYKTV